MIVQQQILQMATKPVAYQRKTSQQRRYDLIDAGIHCLGQGGISAFTIDKICKQAKVSRGLINHHFKTKEELLLCIYASMTDYLVRIEEADSPELQISAFIENSFDERAFKKSNLRAWLAIWGEVATNPALKSMHEGRYAVYKKRLVSAIRKIATARNIRVDANATARTLIALVDGLWLEYCLHSDGFSLAAAKKDCYQFLTNFLEELNLDR